MSSKQIEVNRRGSQKLSQNPQGSRPLPSLPMNSQRKFPKFDSLDCFEIPEEEEFSTDIIITAFNSMKSILSGREFSLENCEKYSNYISEDIINHLIKKYNKTHSFTVNVVLGSANNDSILISQGFIGVNDSLRRSEYCDDWWHCTSIITLISKESRNPERPITELNGKIDGKIKAMISHELEKILFNKKYDSEIVEDECETIIANLIEKLRFRFEEYFFSLVCFAKNDDFGYSSYSNGYYFIPNEDSIVYEVFGNNNPENETKDQILSVVYCNIFRFK